jgi:hypothetical protein
MMQTKLTIIFLHFAYSSFAMPESYIAAPLITAAPAFNTNVIEKRAADQTCGYVSGDPSKHTLSLSAGTVKAITC